jgi:hypothetical protein
MEITGTNEQQLVFLNLHWGRMYVFTAPDSPDGSWEGRAKFGEQDELQAASATEMLHAVRAHYAANKFPGDHRPPSENH